MSMYEDSTILDIMTTKAIDRALKYSEEPELLQGLLKKLKFEVKLDGIRKYFDSDDKERQCLTVTVTRGTKSITFGFGLSIVDTFFLNAQAQKIKCSNVQIVNQKKEFIRMESRLFYGNEKLDYINFPENIQKELNTSSFSKPALAKYLKEKKQDALDDILYSALCSMQSDYYIDSDFGDFCANFGYDEDSIKAEKTWKACLAQSAKLKKVLLESEISCLPA